MNIPRTTLERFRLIETVCRWEGGISNARLRELTGLHTVQISRLIASYLQVNPGNLEHDVSAKRYRWTGEQRSDASIDAYLGVIVALQRQGKTVSPFIHDVRTDLTRVDALVYAVLSEACANSMCVEINYQSMAHPRGSLRIIEPHSIIHVGRRWHVRAWCHLRERFSDFNLGRMRSASLLGSAAKLRTADDNEWSRTVKIRLAPHRLLTSEQAALVRTELLGSSKTRIVEQRACLAPYVIRDLQAATQPELQRPPDYQLEVANVDELRGTLFREALP